MEDFTIITHRRFKRKLQYLIEDLASFGSQPRWVSANDLKGSELLEIYLNNFVTAFFSDC